VGLQIKELLRILEFVHSRQVVHRDIKAENVMVRDLNGQRQLVLIDFGACGQINLQSNYAMTVIG
jgi:serine/threonine protein kinase